MTADVPPAVVRASARAAHDRVGIVGYRILQTTELHAARFYNRSDTFEMAAIFENEKLLAVHILRYTQNGRDSTPEEKSAIQRRLERSASQPGFAVPFDARHFAEYRYTAVDKITTRFTSLTRDSHHGDGTLVQNSAGDVIRMSYIPDALPQHASTGAIVDDRAEVLPGFWATVSEAQHYEGHYGPFRGYGDIVSRESHFVRFASRAAALVALARGDI